MGMFRKLKTLLSKKETSTSDDVADGGSPAALYVRPASATTPRTVVMDAEAGVRLATPRLLGGHNQSSVPSSPAHTNSPLRRVDSAKLAPRIDSITTYTQGMREMTVVERAGSRLVLQGVKTIKPDSDDEDDEDGTGTGGGGSARTSQRGSAGRSPAGGGGGIGSGSLPSAGTPAAAASHAVPPLGSAAAAAAMGRRKPNRVASLPMLLDGGTGIPRAPRPQVAEDLPAPEYVGPQEPEQRPRRPVKRSESLKCLLHLDQYRFNPDVSVQEAREAATGTPTPQGNIEDIITAGASTAAILAVSPALPLRMRRPRWSLEDYSLLKQLHKGYASDVFQARCRISGEMVALKVYKLAEQGDIQRMQLYREIKLHAGLRHSNVVQYYACFLEANRVVLVTEFCTGGDLLRIMYKCGGRLFERQAVNMVLQPFLTALHYLHTQGIVHRDIKPENVFFAEGKILKLADFGLAINLKEERANTRAGTLDYMAPEVLRCPTKKTPDENKENPQSAHYHQSVDAWAVGVFAYELIVGSPPFKAAQMIDTARNIIHAPVAFPDSVSDLAKDFILRALAKDHHERLTVLEMLHHPWITMFQRRSSVRIVYTRSNSLMELMPSPDGSRRTSGVPHGSEEGHAQAHGQGHDGGGGALSPTHQGGGHHAPLSPQAPHSPHSPHAGHAAMHQMRRASRLGMAASPNAGAGEGAERAGAALAAAVGIATRSPHTSGARARFA